jgi:hypothetical protein
MVVVGLSLDSSSSSFLTIRSSKSNTTCSISLSIDKRDFVGSFLMEMKEFIFDLIIDKSYLITKERFCNVLH